MEYILQVGIDERYFIQISIHLQLPMKVWLIKRKIVKLSVTV